MTDIVTIAASIDELPTIEETDAMLAELRLLPRDQRTMTLIDELLEFRSLLGAAGATAFPSSDRNQMVIVGEPAESHVPDRGTGV